MFTQRIHKAPLTLAYLLILIIPLSFSCSQERQERIIGVKIYNHDGSFEDLFDLWGELGINTALTSESLLADTAFRSLARENGITAFVIFPVFFNPEVLDHSPGLYAIDQEGHHAIEEWVEFVCPSRKAYRKQVVDHAVEIIRECDPDGISIDFIRHFVFWEKVYPDREPSTLPVTCFDSTCLELFQEETGLALPDSLLTTEQIATWILVNHGTEWIDWRCSLITSMIQEIAEAARSAKPDILINVHLVPWASDDFDVAIRRVAGQDAVSISRIADLLSPMTYAHMVQREPPWIHSVVDDLYEQTGGRVIPSIQVNKAYLETEMDLEEFERSIEEALKPPSRGVIFWSWERLEQDPRKMELLKDIR